jgi:hypothetical protein
MQLFRVTRFSVLRSAALMALTAAFVAGCRPSVRVATVVGTVSHNGKQVTSGDVVMVGSDGRPAMPARVRADGTFAIDRVLPGMVKVGFFNPPPPPPPPAASSAAVAADPEVEQMKAAVKLYVPTPSKFADPEQSGIVFDLKPGRNECNIDLK